MPKNPYLHSLINKLSVNLGFVNIPRTTLCQQKHTKIKMLPWDFKIFIGIFVGIMVMGFIIIPIIKHLCCVWPRYKNGIGCAKKPCCVYFHFWDSEGKVRFSVKAIKIKISTSRSALLTINCSGPWGFSCFRF